MICITPRFDPVSLLGATGVWVERGVERGVQRGVERGVEDTT